NFYEKGIIKSIVDIYDLHKRKEELEEMEGLGKKSVKIILDGIEKSKEKDFKILLPSLGFSEVGHKVTELLIENGFESIDLIYKLIESPTSYETLKEIHGLGERTSASIIEQLKDKENKKLISELKKRGLNFTSKGIEKSNKPIFKGQSWCVTGSFENFNPRDKAMELVIFYGGKKVSSISSKTTHLLTGEGGGSKLEKAKSLGVQIVNEEEFIKLLESVGYNI
ncbi:MAG: DNA ligase (NAD(+)) LigA, partial [Leptospiraceae bacterium]|nr:DNA ligase (NAD(+)) LigA [Leptospiraceae bacterium]